MKQFTTIKNIVSNSEGETITEVLLSSLLVALAMILLSSMVILSQRLIIQSDTTIQQFYHNVNAMEARSSNTTSSNIQIQISGETSTITLPVTLYYTSDPDLTLYIKQ